jgi:carnitine monooxygenase subunit
LNPQPFIDVCRRLRENVRSGSPDVCEGILELPATSYSDAVQWRREIEEIYHKRPLLLALSCDVRNPGDYRTLNMAGRPVLVVRGDDGVARAFLNVCRHRGALVATESAGNARRFVCPYHSWAYDRSGSLVGIPDADAFGDPGVEGLRALSCEERAGAIFVVLTPGVELELESWLGEMLPSLEALDLDALYPYERITSLPSPNWKLAADGYLDGYHIGFLHRESIGRKSLNNRNTYDLFGPHARIGFATRRVPEIDETPEQDWYLPDYMSLVHFVFPNVSISGGHGDTLMLSRLFPGPTVRESTTVQHQYFRVPVEGEMVEEAEEKRKIYEQVVRDEDCATIFGIGEALDALGTSPVLFGRNEPANQRLHRVIAELTGS